MSQPSRTKPYAAAYARARREREQEAAAGRPRPDKCEACGGPARGRWDRMCFDHDHATGEFRGWLCNPCNKALGLVFDSPATLRALANYLERK